MCIYIYIYMYRKRERERYRQIDRQIDRYMGVKLRRLNGEGRQAIKENGCKETIYIYIYTHIHIYIYIYMYNDNNNINYY